jgi:protein-tyrosine phosphatase
VPKIIKLSGTFNTRDIGGLRNKAGKKVKYGQMYRSDALNNLTTEDCDYLERLGIKTIVDFRSNDEINAAPDKVISTAKTVYLSPNADVAALGSGNIVDDQQKIDTLLQEAATEKGREQLQVKVDEMAEQMKELVSDPFANQQYEQFINLLVQEESLPILHHCKGGKDRTGLAAILTLLILDVPLNAILEEYMLTKDCMAQRNKKRMQEYQTYTDNKVVLEYLSGLMQTKELYFNAAIDEMIDMSGSIDHYLENVLHVTPDKKAHIQALFLED